MLLREFIYAANMFLKLHDSNQSSDHNYYSNLSLNHIAGNLLYLINVFYKLGNYNALHFPHIQLLVSVNPYSNHLPSNYFMIVHRYYAGAISGSD